MSTVSQRSFAAGEISPALYAKVDQSRYATGLRTCRNFFIARHGGAVNRPGTEFIAATKSSSQSVRLIPFIFNSSQTYVLEFGHQYMRVYKAGVQQTDTSSTITGATKANPCVITTSAAHGLSTGNEVQITSVGGMTELNGRNFKVTVLSGTTFSIQDQISGSNINSTAYTTYTSGGTAKRVYTLTTPYAYTDLADLRYVQSADVVTLVHASYQPRELARVADNSWTLSTVSAGISQVAPTGVSVTQAGASGTGTIYQYVVTAISSSGEESLASSLDELDGEDPTIAKYHEVTWNAASGAASYRIYLNVGGLNAFVGSSVNTTYRNYGTTLYLADVTQIPPIARDPFPGANDYPSAVAYLQQRLVFAGSNNNPETLFTSRTGLFHNFTVSTPSQADDAITATLVGRQVNQILHILDLGKPVVLTTGGEWLLNGDSDGVLTPTAINPKQQTYYGSSGLQPIIIGESALFLQSRLATVRDLAFDVQIDGYRGNDLTVFSPHLFEGSYLTAWGYQQVPHSIAWIVRADGSLLGLTYVKDQQIVGWHRHDTDGAFEDVCVVPEELEDAVYVVVRRTIQGATARYIERLSTRYISDIRDAIFMDSALSYPGSGATFVTNMTLSGGTTWEYDETLTLTAADPFFTATDVGNEIQLTGSDDTLIRFRITHYTSTTVVTGQAHKTVPASMRNVAMTTGIRAVDTVSGLWHLEGKDVAVIGDGFVVANPNNPSLNVLTVTNGSLTLDRPYAKITVGLPYLCDLETLDIDTPEGETLAGKKMIVQKVTLDVERSRGIWIGPKPPSDDDTDATEGLDEAKLRDDEDYDSPPALLTDKVEVKIQGEWNSNGRVFIRQLDPLPLTVTAVHPEGMFPFRGKG